MKIGDKVVCVDNSPSICPCCKGTPTGLLLNNVYVIKSFSVGGCTGGIGLHLFGISPAHNDSRNVIFGFSLNRFRLLDELKQLAKERIKIETFNSPLHP